MSFETLEYQDYKGLLRARARWIRKQKPNLTLKRVAERVPMQYTYLSRALNDEDTHLSEDHLFRVCGELDFGPAEIEYVTLLRACAVTQDARRREYLQGRLSEFQRRRQVKAEYQSFSFDHLAREMRYLLDPVAIVVHVALAIEEYRRDALRLCSHLGLSRARLREVLEALEANELIERKSPFEITAVHRRRLHYGKEHPLTRVHQTGLKAALQSRLQQTSEEDKESFFVNFTMDNEGFAKVRTAFHQFLEEVQNISKSSRHKNFYQLNFDLLKWF